MWTSYTDGVRLSPTILATNTENISGTISCQAAVPSIASTVIEMVMRVIPPRVAAAPMTCKIKIKIK